MRKLLALPILLMCTFVPLSVAHSVSININPGAGLLANGSALAAFNRAAAAWEGKLTDPITVNIDANLIDLGSPSILGQASSVQLFTGYDNMRSQMVADAADEVGNDIVNLLPTAAQFTGVLPVNFGFDGNLQGTKANLKALGFTGLDTQFGSRDATIEFNSGFTFDFDNSNGVTGGAFDFETVAIHEIGHALGFISAVDGIDALLDLGQTSVNIRPRLLDLFRFDSNGDNPTNETEFTEFARYLLPGGTSVFNDLDNTYGFSTGVTQGDGRQASHWKANELSGVLLGVLDPTFAPGEVVQISDADLRALDLIGWDLTTTVVPVPAALPLLLSSLVGLGLLGWRTRGGVRNRQ